jgi:hypothetical protein
VLEELIKIRDIKVEAEAWTPRMLTAPAYGVKGGKWHSLMDKAWRPETLIKAFEEARRDKGAAGIDKVKAEAFGAKLKDNIAKLSSDLARDKYKPFPAKKAKIPKSAWQDEALRHTHRLRQGGSESRSDGDRANI